MDTENFYIASTIIIMVLLAIIVILMIVAAVQIGKIAYEVNKPIEEVKKFVEAVGPEVKEGFQIALDQAKLALKKAEPVIQEVISDVPMLIDEGINQLNEKYRTYKVGLQAKQKQS